MRAFQYAGLFAATLLASLGATACVGSSTDLGPGPGQDSGTIPLADSGQTVVGQQDAGGGVDATIGVDASSPADAGQDVAADTAAPVDAGRDATVGADAGSDAGSDAAPDAAMDAGVDSATDAEAGADAAVDTGVDTGIDTGVDAGVDAAIDAGTPVLTITGANNSKITLGNGVPLYISDAHTVWTYASASNGVTYQNLPPALIGTVGNDTVNNATPVNFTLTATATCYLIRQVNWSSVSLAGWTQFDTAAYYFSGYDNGSYGTAIIYSQVFGPGSYNFSMFSAMYACAAQ